MNESDQTQSVEKDLPASDASDSHRVDSIRWRPLSSISSVEKLERRLDSVRQRYCVRSRWRYWTIATLLLGFLAVVAVRWYGQEASWQGTVFSPVTVATVIAIGFALLLVRGWWTARQKHGGRAHIARRLESKFPSLDQTLVTAAGVLDRHATQDSAQPLGYLENRVIDQAVGHQSVEHWPQVVSRMEIWGTRIMGWCAMLGLIGVLTKLTILTPPVIKKEGSARTVAVNGLLIEPGDTQVERGTGLVVTAKFSGDMVSQTPELARLVCVSEDGTRRTFPMRRNLNDATLGTFVTDIREATDYHIEFEEPLDSGLTQSGSYRIEVFEYPALVRSDAVLDFPEYTGMQDKTVQDTRRVAAVEGTELTWDMLFNKSVESATLVARDGSEVPLQIVSQGNDGSPASSNWRAVFESTVLANQKFRLQLMDAEGRQNKLPPEFTIRMLPNQPPVLELEHPTDRRVSPLEEWVASASIKDDFGIRRAGVSYRFGDEEQELISYESDKTSAGTNVHHEFSMEDMGANADDLLTYYFWAEDDGPDGETRRIESDLFLAEVRPFEEIFREGQSPSGGGQPGQNSPQGQQAEQLAESQKLVISATWNLIRKLSAGIPDSLVEDIEVILDSQKDILEQLQQLQEGLRDETSSRYARQAVDAMTAAASSLDAAGGLAELTVPGLTENRRIIRELKEALSSEQTAYQSLLGLRGREFQIVRSNQQQRGGGGGSQNRQKRLQQLELDNEQDRYETQSQASAPSANQDEQRETRQVLNRLRDLAKRQQDLNQQLAQLQSALQLASTEEEKEELERQLKRLREQQQEMLRETDEVAQRMQSARDRQANRESQEQIEQTRENVRQASEALANQEVSQALSAGKRAEREFEQMRDEFRKRAAGEFADEMKQMKQQAEQLLETQEKLSQRSAEATQDKQPGLRETTSDQGLPEQLEAQREALRELLESAEQVVQQAEVSEPLLAQKLYDGYRKAKQSRIDEQLEAVSELVKRGFDREAQPYSERALESVRQLKEDVDRAAESVLGDPAEGLKRAATQLQQLSDQLDQEVNQATGSSPREESEDSERSPSNSSGEDGESQPNQERQDQQSDQPSGQPSPESPSSEASSQTGREPSSQSGREPSPQSGGPGGGEPTERRSNSPTPPASSQSQDGNTGEPSQGGGNRSGNEDSQSDSSLPGSPNPNPSQTRRPAQRLSLRQDGGGGGQIIHGGDLAQERDAGGPITGEGYREWSDSMRDVEEMVDSPELRARASQIRERVREMRRESQRLSKPPQWELVEELVAKPLRELKRDVTEEWMRQSAEKNANVPIDRDPVPAPFQTAVQDYYERLGSGRP